MPPVVFLVSLVLSLLLPLPLFAFPLQARQDTSSPSTTVTTVQTTDTPSGPVTVTCVLVFAPVKDAQGQDLVRQVKTCTLAMGPSENAPTTTSTTTTTLAQTTTTLPATPTPPPTITSSSTSASSVATIAAVPPLGADAAPTTTNSPPAVQTSEIATPSSVGAASDSQLPGKKLSVLPIGLGIFAGISVITLVVVGLVTYERTKYRKAFRQRKLAESGAEMGYGGRAF